MAREVRALVLWGRRLRAPALAVASGGEGRLTGGRGRVCAAPETPTPFRLLCRRGKGTLRAAWETVRFTCQTRGERRALGASWSHLPRSALPGCSQEVTRLNPGVCDYDRGFSWAGVRRRGRGLLAAGAKGSFAE